MSFILAAVLVAGPLPVTVLDGFTLRGWSISCADIRYTPACRANHPCHGDCLSMYFSSNEAYIEVIPKCDGARSGTRRPLALPIPSWDESIPEAIKALCKTDSNPDAALTKQFFDDAETVGALLNKITDEPIQ